MLGPASGVPSVERVFVSLDSPTMGRAGAGGRPCQGVYHRPSGQPAKVALIANHYEVDFSEHYLADYMAERGYGFLGWNTRYRGAEDLFTLEHALIDSGAGMKWLREQGVELVTAHIHPEHTASIAVARHLGLAAGETRSDGEIRWGG